MKRYLLPGLALIAAAGFLIAAYFTEDNVVYVTTAWVLIVAVLLWAGNRGLAILLDRSLPWSKYGNLRFFVHLLLGLLLLLLLLNLSYIALKVIATNDMPTRAQIIVMNAYGAFVFIPIFSIYFSIHFLKHWRKSELEVSKYQEQQVKSQLASLKNHLDPHFLFNNLNILSALIEVDPKRSRVFVDKFAEVYRWILKRSSDDLIPLPDEIDFINSYIFLIRTRFEKNIQFSINLQSNHTLKMVPPLTLQMLVENAIKHNSIYEGSPLSVEINQTSENYLTVSNSLSRKTTNEGITESGSGLQNIRQRYAHFTELPVKVLETDSKFEVHIPLLEPEEV